MPWGRMLRQEVSVQETVDMLNNWGHHYTPHVRNHLNCIKERHNLTATILTLNGKSPTYPLNELYEVTPDEDMKYTLEAIIGALDPNNTLSDELQGT